MSGGNRGGWKEKSSTTTKTDEGKDEGQRVEEE